MSNPTTKDKLDETGIDAICQMIIDGKAYRTIVEELGVSLSRLHAWMHSTPEHSARIREARAATAKFWDEKAEDEIRESADPFSLAKAKELAHHYRWRASKIAPREYGERITQEVDLKVSKTAKDMTDDELAALIASGSGKGAADTQEG